MIVLDTHVLIWAVQGNTRLGQRSIDLIERTTADSSALIPAICAWEVFNVEAKGTVVLPGGAPRWMRQVLKRPGFVVAALDADIALATAALTWEHRDPADRMIVATALHHDAPLLTADRKILDYAAAGHLKVIDARV